MRGLGAEFRMNTRLGEDVTLEHLQREYDAVFLALGAQATRTLEFEGAEYARSALEFLGQVSQGAQPDVGDAVVVVGGGNEAVDAARSAVRLGAERVTLVCEKDRSALSAFSEYVDAAEDEGVTLALETRPVALEEGGGGHFHLNCTRHGEHLSFEASLVIAAPPRVVETVLIEGLGLKVTNRGVAVDRKTLATDLEGVFAGGEVVSGAGPAVRAVAAGRLAAACMGQYLAGGPVTGEPKDVNVVMGRLDASERAALLRDVEAKARVDTSMVSPARRRQNFEEVEAGLTEEQARQEAGRCLQCDCLAREDCKLRNYARDYGVKTNLYRGESRRYERDASHPLIVYESGKCILCGLCVRIAEQAGEGPGMSFTRRGFGGRTAVPFGESVAVGLTLETASLCAEACPTGALALKRTRPSATLEPSEK